MSVKSVRQFKESRRLSYQVMSVLATEFLRSRGMLRCYARWLGNLSDASVGTFMDDHRDRVMPGSRARRAEGEDADRPLLDLIESKETYAQKVGPAIREYIAEKEARGPIKISPALRRRLADLRARPSYDPLPAEEPSPEPEPSRKS